MPMPKVRQVLQPRRQKTRVKKKKNPGKFTIIFGKYQEKLGKTLKPAKLSDFCKKSGFAINLFG